MRLDLALPERIAHVDSMAYLHRWPQLERLTLYTLIVDDKDDSPLLSLPRLREAWVRPLYPASKWLSPGFRTPRRPVLTV